MSDPREPAAAPSVDSVGVEEIDRQHRVLLERWAFLERAGQAGHASGVRSNLWFLRQYFAEHFATEEALMSEAGYPATVKHERAHCELLVRLGELQVALSEGRDPRRRGDFLYVLGWLRSHLAEHDAPMGRFIAARRRIREAAAQRAAAERGAPEG